MNIFILEDDIIQRKYLERIVNGANVMIDRLVSTGKPSELLGQIDTQSVHNLYFLDVDIKKDEKKGLEVAQLIREKDDLGAIIFVTGHLEFAPLTYSYKVSALDFIPKDDSNFEKRIKESLEFVSLKPTDDELKDPFIYEGNNHKIKIPFSDILYFETFNNPHKVLLVSKKRRTEIVARLSNLEKLDSRLFRSHKSFLVNLDNIIEVDKKNLEIIFVNGEKALVARRKLKELLDY